MKKYLLIIKILLITLHVNAQDKVYEFEIKKGRTLTNLTNSRNGNHYIKTGQQIVMAKYKDDRLLCLDKNFNEIYNIDVNSKDFPGNPYYGNITSVSNYGEFYYNVDQLIDKKGLVKEYQGTVKGKTKKIEKISGVNPIFRSWNDFGCVFIGPKIGRKNYKKKYSNEDINIFYMRNDDLKTSINVLESPKFNSNKEVFEWRKGDYFKDKFFLWAVEMGDNDLSNTYKYYIVFYNYDGKIIFQTQFNIKPDSKRFHDVPLHYSDYYGYLNSTGYISGNHSSFYFDEKTNTFTFTGFYTNPLKRKGGKANLIGNYIAKYDKDGNILWSKKYPFNESIKPESEDTNMFYYEIESKGYLIFSKKEKNTNIHVIDKSNGDLLNEHNNILGGFKQNMTNIDRVEIMEFSAEFRSSNYKKKFFSIKAIQSMHINNSIKKYIEKRESESFILYYDASFMSDGSIVLKELNKKQRKIKLLKFI